MPDKATAKDALVELFRKEKLVREDVDSAMSLLEEHPSLAAFKYRVHGDPVYDIEEMKSEGSNDREDSSEAAEDEPHLENSGGLVREADLHSLGSSVKSQGTSSGEEDDDDDDDEDDDSTTMSTYEENPLRFLSDTLVFFEEDEEEQSQRCMYGRYSLLILAESEATLEQVKKVYNMYPEALSLSALPAEKGEAVPDYRREPEIMYVSKRRAKVEVVVFLLKMCNSLIALKDCYGACILHQIIRNHLKGRPHNDSHVIGLVKDVIELISIKPECCDGELLLSALELDRPDRRLVNCIVQGIAQNNTSMIKLNFLDFFEYAFTLQELLPLTRVLHRADEIATGDEYHCIAFDNVRIFQDLMVSIAFTSRNLKKLKIYLDSRYFSNRAGELDDPSFFQWLLIPSLEEVEIHFSFRDDGCELILENVLQLLRARKEPLSKLLLGRFRVENVSVITSLLLSKTSARKIVLNELRFNNPDDGWPEAIEVQASINGGLCLEALVVHNQKTLCLKKMLPKLIEFVAQMPTLKSLNVEGTCLLNSDLTEPVLKLLQGQNNLLEELRLPLEGQIDLCALCEGLKHKESLRCLRICQPLHRGIPGRDEKFVLKQLECIANYMEKDNYVLEQCSFQAISSNLSHMDANIMKRCLTLVAKVDYFAKLNLFGRQKARSPNTTKRSFLNLVSECMETPRTVLTLNPCGDDTILQRHRARLRHIYGLMLENPTLWIQGSFPKPRSVNFSKEDKQGSPDKPRRSKRRRTENINMR